MGWEDTVMGKPQIDEATFPYVTHDGFGTDRKVLEAQAKISFGAGVIEGLARSNDPLEAPCLFCGYSGELYWQKGSHSGGCPFLNVGGAIDRGDKLKELLTTKEGKT